MTRAERGVGSARRGTRSCASTPIACTGSPTGSPATAPTPRTSPRRRSSGSSARWPSTRPGRSRAGCTASPPTCSWTWSGAASGSASTRCPRTPATGWRPRGRARSRPTTQMHLDPEIQAALDALPPDFRVAVVLCDLEQLSYEEIAATLGIKVGTVRSRIHRGPGAAARGARPPRARPSAPRSSRPSAVAAEVAAVVNAQHLSDEASRPSPTACSPGMPASVRAGTPRLRRVRARRAGAA